MKRRLLDLRRRAQSRAIRGLRRSRWWPDSIVDRQGDPDAAPLRGRVMVFFPGPPDTLYQLLPWLPTLSAVHAALGLTIVCQDSRVARGVRRSSAVPVRTVARYGELDHLIADADVALALYVGHASANFECLRFASLLHAYLGHGDSDKGVSASNQLKAYDFVFAPGQAAIERIERRLMRFDSAQHCLVVGQPLTLSAAPVDAPAAEGDVPVVLYAPTWEGAQPSVAYSSVLSHGERLVRALLADGRFTVLYRPHPLIGVTSGAYAAADRAIRELLQAAGPAHRIVLPEQEPLDATFLRASALVCDVSAVATAWLPSLKPIVVTQSAGAESVSADSGMLTEVPRLSAGDADRAADLVAREAADPAGRDRRSRLVPYYLSPYWPDGVEQRFVEVCTETVALRDRLRAELIAGGATGT